MDTPKVSFDKITDLPRYVGKGDFQTKLDDKSGYDHISLSEQSREFLVYFGRAGSWCIIHYLLAGAPAPTSINLLALLPLISSAAIKSYSPSV